MPFVLDEKKEPQRFFYGDDQAEWIDLVLLEDDELQEIRDELGIKGGWEYHPNASKKGNPLEAVPAMMSAEQIKAVSVEAEFRSIPAWRIIDAAGNEIPHSKENVDLMMRKCKAFRKFVDKSRKALRAQQEADLKNS